MTAPTRLRLPDRAEAEALLRAAEAKNPGPWAPHSRYVADGAYRLADCLPGLDAEAAWILGLLHDIGRDSGVSDMRHIIDGYRMMEALGYPGVGRICLTHSFPLQDVRSMQYNWDGAPEDMAFIGDYLDRITYDDYDRLIQLCDALALPDGFCLIEKRLVDVALRRGIHEYTLPKWQAVFAIQRDFEQRIGQPIYALLPGVVENTFKGSN
ncbi:MAG TPA: HD domain-containing protein [Anaerolineaceae bacterium]